MLNLSIVLALSLTSGEMSSENRRLMDESMYEMKTNQYPDHKMSAIYPSLIQCNRGDNAQEVTQSLDSNC